MSESVASSKTPGYPYPDERGRYGAYGGQFVPETLMPALDELEAAYLDARKDPAFLDELAWYQRHYVGRPTPLYYARRMTEQLGGAKVYFKREDLAHTGAHKINNTVGQALLANHLGKRRLIAETGAGQHGVATAMAGALMGMETVVYMGEKDTVRQRANVFRMQLLGAQVVPVLTGTRTLKDAINEALRDWAGSFSTTHYLIGSVMGPHPFPAMVRDLQSVIGREAREQAIEQTGSLPDAVVACVGGGSNAMGIFYPFIDDDVDLVGVEAAGKGVDTLEHCATISRGERGVFHGMHSYVLQDNDGQIRGTHSISAGLDYPGVWGPNTHILPISAVRATCMPPTRRRWRRSRRSR